MAESNETPQLISPEELARMQARRAIFSVTMTGGAAYLTWRKTHNVPYTVLAAVIAGILAHRILNPHQDIME